MKKIEVIKPAVFGDDTKAFFTLKNRGIQKEDANISGFNLGYNTDEDPEIISSNRNRLADLFENKSTQIAYANQVHGSTVCFVKKAGTVEDCDALITQTKGLALAIQVADCAAVLIHERESKIIAAVHAGWRGAATNIIPKTLAAMQKKGAELTSARAYISPCICAKHFEIGEEVAEKFPALFIDAEDYKKPHIDLKGFLRSQLIENGLVESNIEVDEGCTIEDEHRFYSYRREKEKSGRMMALIQLKPPT